MAFQKAIKESEIPDGKVGKAKVGKKEFAIIHVGQAFYCVDGICTHEGGPLGEGSLDDGKLVCPWHDGRYDYKTGEADPETDWVTDVKSYKTKVEGGFLWIDF
ncbi:MAG TPA: Rieske 2Fe-2S domain-containing protein [Thermoplasmata archaeon]|nr:Rieske 2Fe-2S domain-containing protein [Thermoplasmata archaeon]